MDPDVARLLDTFADEIAALPAGSAPPVLVGRTAAALRDALTSAAGRPKDEQWGRLYRAAEALVEAVDDRWALPGLRAFLADNDDLCDDSRELVPT